MGEAPRLVLYSTSVPTKPKTRNDIASIKRLLDAKRVPYEEVCVCVGFGGGGGEHTHMRKGRAGVRMHTACTVSCCCPPPLDARSQQRAKAAPSMLRRPPRHAQPQPSQTRAHAAAVCCS
jgi:hypothetical protein